MYMIVYTAVTQYTNDAVSGGVDDDPGRVEQQPDQTLVTRLSSQVQRRVAKLQQTRHHNDTAG